MENGCSSEHKGGEETRHIGRAEGSQTNAGSPARCDGFYACLHPGKNGWLAVLNEDLQGEARVGA